MKTKTLTVYFITAIFIVASTTTPSFAQESEQLFQKGLMKENGEGNLQDALRIYEQIVADENAENEVKAKAQLHIGLCYEKLGKADAIKAYELVLQNYQNQEEEVQVASIRLSELRVVENDEQSVSNPFEKEVQLYNSMLSPDGTKLAGLDYTSGQNIAVYDRLTGGIKLITNYDWSTPGHGWNYYPIWSPDGTEIVHLFSEWTGTVFELHITTLAGETRTLLKSEPNGGKIIPRQWSQDGSNILILKQDTTGSYTIGLQPAKGGSFKTIYIPQWKSQFVLGDAAIASLSPDGKFVVLADGAENKMDVFVINIDEGTTTVLSDHPADESSVVWSPDGKHIAFTRKTQGGTLLYAVEMTGGNPVGQPFLVKEGMQKVGLNNWTEHGLCYSLWLDIHDIHTLPLNAEAGTPSGEPKFIDYTPTGSNVCPAWSHDGKNLAFISYTEVPEVVLMPSDGGEIRKYTIPDFGLWAVGVYDLNWLPDDSGVGFSFGVGQPTTAYLLKIATGEWQSWVLPIANNRTRIAWGPDENSFVFAKWKDSQAETNIPDPGLHQFNISTGETQLIFTPPADTGAIFMKMKFSWDHKKLTFRYENKSLMVLDLESGESRMLTKKFWAPSFSPDGQKILAFGVKYSVAVLSLEGEVLQQYSLSDYFAPGTRLQAPVWSPDGTKLVFQTRNMEYKTYIMMNVLK